MDRSEEHGFSLMSPWLVVACAIAYIKLVNTALPNQNRVPSITWKQLRRELKGISHANIVDEVCARYGNGYMNFKRKL